MIRPLTLFVPPYAAAVAVKNIAYHQGWATSKQLAWPVVSIGNLSVGGAGKTPLVIRLAQLLSAENIPADVLSRGYGRNSTAIERVDPQGAASRYGDEPLLIARAANIPVFVGADRYQAGLLAERNTQEQGIHLLDDGFQHRKLARAMDIVVLHRSDFEESLLPAGRLREPLSSLHRANAIVLRAEDRALESELRSRNIPAPVWIQHRSLAVESVTQAVAFCGIARPDGFFSALHAQGVELIATHTLRDHQPYTDATIQTLLRLQCEHSTTSFVTTEKDEARLTPQQREILQQAAPLRIARLNVRLEDEPSIIRQILALAVRK